MYDMSEKYVLYVRISDRYTSSQIVAESTSIIFSISLKSLRNQGSPLKVLQKL